MTPTNREAGMLSEERIDVKRYDIEIDFCGTKAVAEEAEAGKYVLAEDHARTVQALKDDYATARRTSAFHKDNHLAAEREIASLTSRLAAVISALDALSDPEDSLSCAINAGPELDELQRAYDEVRK